MKLKAILENLDGVDDALKAAYTEKDGKFYLNVEGYHPAEVDTLRTSLRRVKKEKTEAQQERDDIKAKYAGLGDDFDVEDYNASLDKGGGKIDERLAEQRRNLTKQHETKMAEANAKLDAATKRADRLYSDNALMSALSEANIAKPMLNAVKAMFRDQVKVEYEGDDAIVTIDSLPVTDKIKSWAGTEEGKYFVAAPANGGGGSGGQGSGGGKSYDKMSNTELMLAQDKDPQAKAEFERRTKIDTKPLR